MNVSFTYHGIGQGLFYSGEVDFGNGDPKFNFVYDCGTNRNRTLLRNAISVFHTSSMRKIDLLVLSHFDDDHINGVDELLQNTSVNSIVIPFLKEEEMQAAGANNKFIPNGIYDDPVKYFLERKEAKRVFMIVGGGQNEGKISTTEGDESVEVSYDRSKVVDLPDERLKGDWNDFISKGKLIILNHKSDIVFRNRWLFRFLNHEVDRATLNMFRMCIDHIQTCNNNFNKRQTLREMLQDSRTKRCLKACYQCVFSSINMTSLMMLHGPVKSSGYDIRLWNDIARGAPSINLVRPIIPAMHMHSNDGFFQIMSGDINLRICLREIVSHFSSHNQKVKMFQVPHHGSINNWDVDVLNSYNNAQFWPISSKLTNSNRFPSQQVVSNIQNGSMIPAWANQHERLIIMGKIT